MNSLTAAARKSRTLRLLRDLTTEVIAHISMIAASAVISVIVLVVVISL